MQRTVRDQRAQTSDRTSSEATAEDLRCIAVCGESDAPISDAPDLVILRFHDISAATLSLHQPDVVLSPLVSEAFDCLDLAHALSEAGFRGRYRAVAAHIPDPGLVRREIRSMAPQIDFDIILVRPRDGAPDH